MCLKFTPLKLEVSKYRLRYEGMASPFIRFSIGVLIIACASALVIKVVAPQGLFLPERHPHMTPTK